LQGLWALLLQHNSNKQLRLVAQLQAVQLLGAQEQQQGLIA
jgi:hypothetical protein